jgi:hypothetical protein
MAEEDLGMAIDPGTIASGLGAARSGWAFIQYLREVQGAEIISGLFKFDGTLIEGSDWLQVEVHKSEKDDGVWWYSVEEPQGYAFLREPVVPSSCHELVGTISGEKNPNARYWRWVAPVLPGRLYGGGEPPSVETDFLIFGYRPGALLNRAK